MSNAGRTRSCGRRWAACAAGAVALFLATAPAADSPWLYGIHWYGDEHQSDVEAMTGAKPIWVLETVMGRDTGAAGKFSRIAAKGHTILCRIQPEWGLAVPRPENLTAYLNDVSAVAQAYSSSVHIWQIGNEMNLYLEYSGEYLSPADYIEAYRQIRQRIRAVTSPLGPQIVLVGPVSPGGAVPGVRHTDGNAYLDQMCSLLRPDDTDGFAIHAYAAPWSSPASSRTTIRNTYASQLAVIDARGFSAKPVYMTEWNRKVEPLDAAHEADSALTIIGAFTDLDAWNRTPGNHPIVCACWFIYPPDAGWTNYSLRALRDVHPRGAQADLWDAFQYACSLNLPAGDDTPAGTTPTPSRTPTPTPTVVRTPLGSREMISIW